MVWHEWLSSVQKPSIACMLESVIARFFHWWHVTTIYYSPYSMICSLHRATVFLGLTWQWHKMYNNETHCIWPLERDVKISLFCDTITELLLHLVSIHTTCTLQQTLLLAPKTRFQLVLYSFSFSFPKPERWTNECCFRSQFCIVRTYWA